MYGPEILCENRYMKLMVFEKRVLRRLFGPERDEVTAGWRKMHNDERHNLYSSPYIIRIKMDEMVGACSTHRGDGKCVQNFSWKAGRDEINRKTYSYIGG
jgi:hypothetical protein